MTAQSQARATGDATRPPLLLAVDTSTRVASVALATPDGPLAEYSWRAGQDHTRQLLPVIDAVLKENQHDVSDLTVLAVARGPGSFNGLRVGMATVKGLAGGLGIPVVAVGTLEIEAYQHAATSATICAVQDAGRGELAWALFLRHPQRGWVQLQEEQISPPEAVARRVRGRVVLCGEIPAWCRQTLCDALQLEWVATPAAAFRRAAFLAELGWQRLERGQIEDVATLQPLYLRRPSITQPKRQTI